MSRTLKDKDGARKPPCMIAEGFEYTESHTRINWTVLLTDKDARAKLREHLPDCTGICKRILVHVELARIIGTALFLTALLVLLVTRTLNMGVVISAGLAVLCFSHAYERSRYEGLYHFAAHANDHINKLHAFMENKPVSVAGSLKELLEQLSELGADVKVEKIAPDEDPIDRIIRESQAEAERRRKRGDGPVS